MAGKIFLNYRRADSEAWADRLFERLIAHFPRGDVFMDIDGNIPFGFPWAAWLDQQVSECDLMLVLIGRSWVHEFQPSERPMDRDFVKVEIESALRREIPVVPVFLGETSIPDALKLPETIRPLLELQAARIQRPTFDTDVKVLIEGVVRSIQLARAPNPVEETVDDEPPSPTPASAVTVTVADAAEVEAPIAVGESEHHLVPDIASIEVFQDDELAPQMVIVPAGEAEIGEEDATRLVTFSSPFAVARYPVTFNEWDAACAEHGLSYWPDDRGWGRGQHPVINVSWYDACAYTEWLSSRTGQSYRLLSEDEWEYCCRAGTTTLFSFGDRLTRQQAQFSEVEFGSAGSTAEVGSYPPNPWGIYDMHGNVWEWCSDGDDSFRALRGGSWILKSEDLRSAHRHFDRPGVRILNIGFRIAQDLNSDD